MFRWEKSDEMRKNRIARSKVSTCWLEWVTQESLIFIKEKGNDGKKEYKKEREREREREIALMREGKKERNVER